MDIRLIKEFIVGNISEITLIIKTGIIPIKDFIIVSIPEITLMIITGLIIGTNSSIFKEIKFIKTKILISVVTISLGIFLIRSNLQSIQSITLACLILYISSYKFIFEMNIRKSIVTGSIVMLILISTEIAVSPLLSYISEDFFRDIEIVTIITRITQIVIAIVLYKINFYIGHMNIVSTNWNELSLKEKCTSIVFILLLIIVILFNTNYSDLYIKLHKVGIKIKGMEFSYNMGMYFLQNMLWSILIFYMINRTRKYYIYEEFLQKGDKEMLLDLLDLADEETIKEYIDMSKLYLKEKSKGGENK